MSYEYCEKHGRDSTNGCRLCKVEEAPVFKWNHGALSVAADGSVDVSPDDDFYGHTLKPSEALALARFIIELSEIPER